MIDIKILKKGDSVLTVNDRFLAVKRESGEVDIYRVMFNDENELAIDPVKSAVIGYGEGMVSKTLEDGETTLFTF